MLDYNREYAQSMAQARVAQIPALTNDALVRLFAIQRRAALGPEDFSDLNAAVQLLCLVVCAPDALRIEQEAAHA